ncbi:MAG: hypothetical protein F6K31_16895 [Symploca sp. SIO2G7]|nr:hypothetical protein [Symploca sp. SIO2G7]
MASPKHKKNRVDFVYTNFLGGATLGSFLILLPLLYSDIDSFEQITGIQICLGLLVILSCGFLTAKLGRQFVDTVMKGIENAGF